jgi:hypothetical protein
MIKLDKNGGTKEDPIYCLTITWDNDLDMEPNILNACKLMVDTIDSKLEENANEQRT